MQKKVFCGCTGKYNKAECHKIPSRLFHTGNGSFISHEYEGIQNVVEGLWLFGTFHEPGYIKKRNLLCLRKKVNKLKLELKEVKFLTLTSDIWSNRKKSFIGFTCHWICNEKI